MVGKLYIFTELNYEQQDIYPGNKPHKQEYPWNNVVSKDLSHKDSDVYVKTKESTFYG